MSQWIHVVGSLELESTFFEIKNFNETAPKKIFYETDEEFREAYWRWRARRDKKLYLPFPEEQFKLSAPISAKTSKDESKLVFKATLYSLPRARKYIEEAVKLLPQGELGFRYFLSQTWQDCNYWSSGFDIPCLRKCFDDALDKMYQDKNPLHNISHKDLRKYEKVDKSCSVDYVRSILMGVKDDIRYCSGEELQDSLLDFFKYLQKHEIILKSGYLEWEDEYEPEVIYAWRGRTTEMRFLLLDKKTNRILKQKCYKLDESVSSVAGIYSGTWYLSEDDDCEKEID